MSSSLKFSMITVIMLSKKRETEEEANTLAEVLMEELSGEM